MNKELLLFLPFFLGSCKGRHMNNEKLPETEQVISILSEAMPFIIVGIISILILFITFKICSKKNIDITNVFENVDFKSLFKGTNVPLRLFVLIILIISFISLIISAFYIMVIWDYILYYLLLAILGLFMIFALISFIFKQFEK